MPVVSGVDDGEANAVTVTLDRAGIDSQKEADPASEGKFRILVARDDAAPAISVLRDEELPRPHTKGVLEAVGQGALVPSQASEHAQYVAGLQGDLEHTLNGVEGVLKARVHLNLPAPDPLKLGGSPSKASASVLLEHRGSTTPMTAEAMQRLVAGGAPGLAVTDVAVLLVPRIARADKPDTRLAHVGPFTVARGSKVPIQGTLVLLILAVLALLFATAGLYARAARLTRELEKNV
jgi:type III secretion protein J